MTGAFRRFATLSALAVALPLMVAGCGFQPLYGTGPGGAQLDDVMRTVTVAPVPGRVGQRVRNELIYTTTGGGYAEASLYRLEIAIRESVEKTLVDRAGDSEGRVYQLLASFRLIRLEDGAELMTGQSIGRASYDNLDSTFADVRARRDAENRAARSVSTDIQTRIATALSREV